MGRCRYSVTKVEVVTSLDRFSELESAWEKLIERAGMDDYYLSHRWLKLWFGYFYPEGLYVILLWKNDDLALAAPLVATESRYHGLRIRKSISTRDYYSPVGAVICPPQAEEAIEVLFQYLRKAKRKWDLLDLDGLPMEYEQSQALVRWIERTDWPSHVMESYGNWVLRDLNSWEGYWKHRSKRKLRRKSIVYRDRLLELGDLRTRILSNGDKTDTAFRQFYDICQRSWKKDVEQHPEFLKATMDLAGRHESFRIAFLDLDDKPIASWYAFLHKSTAYFPRTAYIDKYRRHMPGFVLLEDFLRYLVEKDGVQKVDFQHGAESYKSRWGNERNVRKRLIVANPKSWKGRAYVCCEYGIKPKLEATPLWRGACRVRDIFSDALLSRAAQSAKRPAGLCPSNATEAVAAFGLRKTPVHDRSR